MLRLDATVAPYYGKALFWVHAASHGNNCITCSFHAVLLGRLHGACFLRYDIDAYPDATMTMLHLNAASPLYYGKALFWAHIVSHRNKSNVHVSRWLAVLTSWPFLLFCDIIFNEVFALCNMNSREGGLRGGAGQPRHAWVVPNNSDRLWFKRC